MTALSGNITSSSQTILTSATSFSIDGSGFTTCGNASAGFDNCLACAGAGTNISLAFNQSRVLKPFVDFCVVSTRTQLTVLFNSSVDLVAEAPALVYATLLDQLSEQSAVVVGVLTLGPPQVTPNPGLTIRTNDAHFEILGSGFSTQMSDMAISLSPPSGAGTAQGFISSATTRSITITLTQLSPRNSLNGGELSAVVTLLGLQSSSAVVATVVDSLPVIVASTNNAVAYTACSFTISGTGFDYVEPSNNVVELSQAFGTCYDNAGAEVTTAACPVMNVTVTNASRTQLVCTFDRVLALNAGPTAATGVATTARVYFGTNGASSSATEQVVNLHRAAVTLLSASPYLLDANDQFVFCGAMSCCLVASYRAFTFHTFMCNAVLLQVSSNLGMWF